MSKTIAAGEFKAKCLALLDEVAETGKELVITKRGKKVAKLVALGKEDSKKIFGRQAGTGEILGDIFSTGEKWEADS